MDDVLHGFRLRLERLILFPVEQQVELENGEGKDPVGPEVVGDPRAFARPLQVPRLVLEDGRAPAFVACAGAQEDAQ
eukprot:6615110-Alexandrium_andersonii.AAC.1